MGTPHEYDVVLTPAPEGGYVVSVPELPDVHTEGKTREEALAMTKDAIEGYLEAMRERGWSPKAGEARASRRSHAGLARHTGAHPSYTSSACMQRRPRCSARVSPLSW